MTPPCHMSKRLDKALFPHCNHGFVAPDRIACAVGLRLASAMSRRDGNLAGAALRPVRAMENPFPARSRLSRTGDCRREQGGRVQVERSGMAIVPVATLLAATVRVAQNLLPMQSHLPNQPRPNAARTTGGRRAHGSRTQAEHWGVVQQNGESSGAERDITKGGKKGAEKGKKGMQRGQFIGVSIRMMRGAQFVSTYLPLGASAVGLGSVNQGWRSCLHTSPEASSSFNLRARRANFAAPVAVNLPFTEQQSARKSPPLRRQQACLLLGWMTHAHPCGDMRASSGAASATNVADAANNGARRSQTPLAPHGARV